MARSIWKGPVLNSSILKKIHKVSSTGQGGMGTVGTGRKGRIGTGRTGREGEIGIGREGTGTGRSGREGEIGIGRSGREGEIGTEKRIKEKSIPVGFEPRTSIPLVQFLIH